MKLLQGQKFSSERALYGENGLRLLSCAFEGEEDGESALKECADIYAENCLFKLRYPLWHDDRVVLCGCEMTETCRAALWYSRDISIKNCNLLGIKALRECERAEIVDSRIVSPEFGWKCRGASLENCSLKSEYAFLLSENLRLKGIDFSGKYAFQYIKECQFEDCALDTKDAFWHAENVTVKNCTVKGEYLGWYSRNLTFINCKIIGTQPLCYCQGLKLIDCEMINTDLSFEYSDVQAEVNGDIMSVKNPKSGKIVADSIGEVIITKDSKYPCNCEIIVKNLN